MKRLSLLVGIVVALAWIAGAGGALAQTAGVVREIAVEGTQRVEPETVRSYLLIQEGDPYDPRRVDRSLKSLFATGLFADVTMRQEGSRLIVSVVENPVINRIAFEGNKRLEDKDLEAEVSLRPRVIYTRTKVQNDVQRLLTLYRRSGRFAATVEPKVIRLDQNRVDLVFEINEGKLTEIRNIRFVGNREYSDSRLREVVRTKESRWYRFLSSDDTYDPDRMTLDRELLRRFYLSEGFADFNVVSAVAEMTADRKDFFVTFAIDEGARYKFGKIDVEAGLRDLDGESLKGDLEMEEGDWYDADLIDKTIDDLSTKVSDLGYAFVDVRPRVKRDREAKTVAISFEVNEGSRVFVERIDINGNVRTIDKVLRREMRLVEGDAFNTSKLRRSRTRIQNLDFFSKVNVEQVPGSAPDKTVINVDVTEKSTGSLSVGAGFSTTNGALFEVGIREKNLLGKGQDLKLNGTVAQRKSQIDLAFTEPYFMDREVAAGFDVFHINTDYQDTSSFDTSSDGLALRASYPITEFLRQGWRYTVKQSDVSNVPSSASSYIKAQEGGSVLSEVSHTLVYDRRDNRLNPHDGYYLRMGNDLAGLGGTSRYLRNTVGAGKYFPLGDQLTLVFSGDAGHMLELGKDIGLLDRFFVGGDDLRGFASAGVGPRDKSTEDALGGEWKYTGTAQVNFPLGFPAEIGVSGNVFTDVGSSGKIASSGSDIQDTGSLRASAGVGVAWTSPFGPIGLDFGVPLIKESFDQLESIRLNFGTRF